MLKKSVRAKYLAERKSRQIETCTELSAKVQQRFLLSNWFCEASSLALYSAVHNEVLTDSVFRAAIEGGKLLAYPRVRECGLEFIEVHDLTDLAPGAFGVLEPQGDGLVPVEALDLVVVPGVAFDFTGNRLGYGRGFYDRALARCHKGCERVGFAYDSQLIETLPAAEHDEPLTVLLTESRTLTWPINVDLARN